MDSFGDTNKMNNQMARDVITSFAKVLQGSGNIAESQIDALMPQTLKSKYGNFKQFVTSRPQPAELKEFLDQYRHSMKAEKETMVKNIHNGMDAIANQYDPSVGSLSPYAQKAWEMQKMKARENFDKWALGGGAKQEGKVTEADIDNMTLEQLKAAGLY